jgi:hypothetical protein
MNQVGVIYVAFGAPYLAQALISIASLRIFNASVPVCVVTNVCKAPPSDFGLVQDCEWIFIEEASSNNRFIKTNIYPYSPFEKTLYLDCDTLVLSDISQIAFFLKYFDILLKHNETNRLWADSRRVLFDGALKFGEIGSFNGGVLGFRKAPNVEEFFNCWTSLYGARRKPKRDQPSLAEAIYKSNVRLLPLPRKWNEGDLTYADSRTRSEVVIWHYKARGMDSNLESYLLRVSNSFFKNPKDLQSVKAFIESQRKHRGYKRNKQWLLKSLIAGFRGSLSKRPSNQVGEDNWKRLLSGQRLVAAPPDQGEGGNLEAGTTGLARLGTNL